MSIAPLPTDSDDTLELRSKLATCESLCEKYRSGWDIANAECKRLQKELDAEPSVRKMVQGIHRGMRFTAACAALTGLLANTYRLTAHDETAALHAVRLADALLAALATSTQDAGEAE